MLNLKFVMGVDAEAKLFKKKSKSLFSNENVELWIKPPSRPKFCGLNSGSDSKEGREREGRWLASD